MSKRAVETEVNAELEILLPTDMVTTVRRCLGMQHKETKAEIELLSRTTKVDEFTIFARHVLITALKVMYKGWEQDMYKTAKESAEKAFARGIHATKAEAYLYHYVSADGKHLLTDEEVIAMREANKAEAAKATVPTADNPIVAVNPDANSSAK